MSDLRPTARNVAFLAIFAALSVVVIEFVPGIPIVGSPGSQMKFDAAIAPIYGMIIGPYYGFLAALIGGLVTAGSPFTFLTSFSPAISAMIAGFLTSKKFSEGTRIPGWIPAAVISSMLIGGWYLTWVGIQAPLYPVLHLAGLFAILITRKWTAQSFSEIGIEKEGWQLRSNHVLFGIILIVCAYMFSKSYVSDLFWISPYLSLPLYIISAIFILYGIFGGGQFSFISSTFLASYCGIIADHMLGNLVYIGSIGLFIPLSDVESALVALGLPDVPSLFMYMIPITTVERLVWTIIGTVFGVGLLMALHKSGLLSRIS